ncbi:hypothetical protein [Streptomyces buecherae]|uniref:hypothetical protein n=1 Tax=Streptomyces buecherae TaxID=2763006 RepID=UPI0036AD85B7
MKGATTTLTDSTVSGATATTLTSAPVSADTAFLTAGGIYRRNGTMTLTTSPVGGDVPHNRVGSSPAVPGRVG